MQAVSGKRMWAPARASEARIGRRGDEETLTEIKVAWAKVCVRLGTEPLFKSPTAESTLCESELVGIWGRTANLKGEVTW